MRSLNTSKARRVVLEFAHRRRQRGREWFSFADLYRVFRVVLGQTSKPNVNRHVLAFISVDVIERTGWKNAQLRLTDDGADVYADWAGGTQTAHTPSLLEAQQLADGARRLLDDLVEQLRIMARA